jgi:hypothetical protein
MPFLTIGSFGEVLVLSNSAGEGEREEGGEDVRAHAGNLRTVVSWTKRNWNFSGYFQTKAAYNSLMATIANGAQVACSGDALDGASVTCRVKMTGADYVDKDGTGFEVVAKLSLREV